MSKIKMRCITCGKWFQSANAREVTCPDCTQKARKEKLATKNTPPTSSKPVGTRPEASRPPAPPKPKPAAHSGTNQWLDNLSDVKIGQPDQPPQRPKVSQPPVQRDTNHGPGTHRAPQPSQQPHQGGQTSPAHQGGSYGQNRNTGPSRGPEAYHSHTPSSFGQRSQASRYPSGGPGRGPQKPWQKSEAPNSHGGPHAAKGKGKPRAIRPATPPKPRKEKTPPPAPFVPTDEQVKQVEERYIVLAQPAEFDGIRTQISRELNIPKKAVKKIIKDLRDRDHIPSWWEIQTYKGSTEELEQIKAVYEPYLPVPPVGVHKKIAETLSLKPGTVYQAIKAIRMEMNLPQYNDPKLHTQELQHHANASASREVSSALTSAVADTSARTNSTTSSDPSQGA